jgi:hypothetical protein
MRHLHRCSGASALTTCTPCHAMPIACDASGYDSAPCPRSQALCLYLRSCRGVPFDSTFALPLELLHTTDQHASSVDQLVTQHTPATGLLA